MRKKCKNEKYFGFDDCVDVDVVKKWCSRLTSKDCASIESFVQAIKNYQECHKNADDDCNSMKD